MRCNMLTLSDKLPVIRSQPQPARVANYARDPDEVIPDGLITLTLITQTKLISGIMRRNKDQPFANQTQWGPVRVLRSGRHTTHRDRKLKYYTLCSAQGLSHHNYLRTRNFCHSIPIRIIRSRPPSKTLKIKQLNKHARFYDRKSIFY